jgi:hypothetical protein
MLLSLASSLLLAGLAQAGPASSYGAQAQPARQVATSGLHCRTEFVTLWDTKYEEREEQVCTTVYKKECETRTQRLCQPTSRQECHQEYEQQCATVYRNVCVQKYRTEYEPYTESECTTLYKQDCQYQWEGQGNAKVWAPIDGTCQNVPYDECHDVAKTHSKQVAYQDCKDVPEQKCVSVPKQVCVTVPDQVCRNEPLTECQDVPRQACHAEHKRFPIRVSKQVPKKTCITSGVHAAVPAAPQPVFPEAPGAPEVFLPDPVPGVASNVGPDERNNIEFSNTGTDSSLVVDVAKLQLAQDGSAITFTEHKV